MDLAQQLEETLQLLNHSYYYNHDIYHRSRHLHEHSEFRILDTICAVLTTGKPGDVYAAAFDKEAHLKLVLAKEGIVSPEDRAAVQQLIDIVSSPTLSKTYFDFLLTRCRANIAKQVKNVHDTMTQFFEVIDDALASYHPAELLTDEFPNGFDAFCKIWYRTKPLPMTTHGKIRDLFHAILHLSNQLTLSDEYQEKDFSTFGLLSHLATIARKSRFLLSICGDEDVPDSEQKQFLTEKLKRRLAKLSLYMEGINKVNVYARRFRESGIAICWANPKPNIEEPVVEPADYITAIRRNLPRNSALTDTEIQVTVNGTFPALQEKWTRNVVHTCVHAEIRIILYFLQKNAPVESNKQQLMGCSKRSCLACTLWIDAFNIASGTNWMTSRTHGKPYTGWAVPRLSEHSDKSDKIEEVNERFFWTFSDCVHNLLELLIPYYRQRVTDDRYSSDPLEPLAPGMDAFLKDLVLQW